MGWGHINHWAILLCATALAPGTAVAQDGGLTAGLVLTPGLSWDDDELSAKLGIGVTLESNTSNQRLSFAFDGAIEEGLTGSLDDNTTDPRLDFSYGRESRNSALSFDLGYRRAEISSLTLDDDLTTDLLILDDGSREDLDIATTLIFGREGPFGATLDLGYREERYIDTTDPNLLDEVTMRAALGLRFRIDPRITATLGTRVSETDVDGATGTDSRNEAVTAGLELAVNPSLTTEVSIGYSQVTQSFGGTDTTDSGLTYALALLQERPNGTVSAQIRSEITEDGRLTEARVARSLDLTRGALSFGIGVSDLENQSLQPLLALSWQQELPRGAVGISLEQTVAVDTDGDSAVNRRLGVNWQQDFDRLTNLSTGLVLRDTEVLSGTGSDLQQIDLSISWRRALTPDWNMLSSYTRTLTSEKGVRDTTDNTLFFGFERGFQWRL